MTKDKLVQANSLYNFTLTASQLIGIVFVAPTLLKSVGADGMLGGGTVPVVELHGPRLQLARGSDDGAARLWDVDYHTTMTNLCYQLRDFTDDERTQYGITDNTPTCPK